MGRGPVLRKISITFHRALHAPLKRCPRGLDSYSDILACMSCNTEGNNLGTNNGAAI